MPLEQVFVFGQHHTCRKNMSHRSDPVLLSGDRTAEEALEAAQASFHDSSRLEVAADGFRWAVADSQGQNTHGAVYNLQEVANNTVVRGDCWSRDDTEDAESLRVTSRGLRHFLDVRNLGPEGNRGCLSQEEEVEDIPGAEAGRVVGDRYLAVAVDGQEIHCMAKAWGSMLEGVAAFLRFEVEDNGVTKGSRLVADGEQELMAADHKDWGARASPPRHHCSHPFST